MIRINQVSRPLPRYLEKLDLFGKETGKQKEYLKRKVQGRWAAVGPLSTVLTVSEDLKCGRAANPKFVTLPSWLGVSAVLRHHF